MSLTEINVSIFWKYVDVGYTRKIAIKYRKIIVLMNEILTTHPRPYESKNISS